jgi:ABC-2 type transport system ATP-binding protein
VVRRFLDTYLRRHGATLLLTSHDMDDVAALCDRILLIDEGVLRFDGSLEALQARFGDGRRLLVRGPAEVLEPLGFTRHDARTFVRNGPADEINRALAQVLAVLPSADVTVTDPPLEAVLRRAFGRDPAPGAP